MLSQDHESAVRAIADKPEYTRFRPILLHAIEGWQGGLNPYPYEFGVREGNGGIFAIAGVEVGENTNCACLLGAALLGKPVPSGSRFESIETIYQISTSEAEGLSIGFDYAESDFGASDDYPSDHGATKCGEEVALALGFLPAKLRADRFHARG